MTKKVSRLKMDLSPKPYTPKNTNMNFDTLQKKIMKPKEPAKIKFSRPSLKPDKKIPNVPQLKSPFKDISKPRYKNITLKPKGGKHGLKWNFGNTPGSRGSKG